MLTALVKMCRLRKFLVNLIILKWSKFSFFFLLFCVGIYYVAGESGVLALLNKQFIVPICS